MVLYVLTESGICLGDALREKMPYACNLRIWFEVRIGARQNKF